jgi:hypothetical protein
MSPDSLRHTLGSQTLNSTEGHSADQRKSRTGPTSGFVFHTEHLSLPWSPTWASGFGQGILNLWCVPVQCSSQSQYGRHLQTWALTRPITTPTASTRSQGQQMKSNITGRLPSPTSCSRQGNLWLPLHSWPLKVNLRPACWCMLLIPALRRKRQVDLWEFKTSLV